MHLANASIWSASAGSIVAVGSPGMPPAGSRSRHALSASSIAFGSSGPAAVWGSSPFVSPPTCTPPGSPAPPVTIETLTSTPCSFMHFVKASMASSGSSEARGAADWPGDADGSLRLTTPPSDDEEPQAASPSARANATTSAEARPGCTMGGCRRMVEAP